MELASLLRAVVLYMSSISPDISINNESSNPEVSEIRITELSPAMEPTVITIIPEENILSAVKSNTPDAINETDKTEMIPYDCSMPYPPIDIDPPSSTNPLETVDANGTKSTETAELQHPKASLRVPLHIVHRLDGSHVLQLHRYVDYCEDKIFECYSAIKDFNNYNYEKNQEIQYLSYTEKRKQEIIQQSQELKTKIEVAYNKTHRVCGRAERYRHKITTILNPYLTMYSKDFAQPKRIPKVWYDIHNLETVIQQLFTPKLRVHTYYDAVTHELRMSRYSIENSERKEFIALTKDYLNSKYGDGSDDGETIDGASMIMENNHPDTAIGVQTKQASTAEQFNSNILEQNTYSSNKDIQQIIIYYEYKFYELKVRDGTRRVFHYIRLLKLKKKSNANQSEISDLEDRLQSAIKELQADTIEMERNRVTPELIGVYNAENAAHELLPQTKYITKLIGSDNKRVITAFNPSDLIAFHLWDSKDGKTDLSSGIDGRQLATVSADSERDELEEPLYWDQNWTWDY